MSLVQLSDVDLLNSTIRAVGEERRATNDVLLHLREVERRKLYAERGYSSLWKFVTQHLGYSEGSAYRRVAAMRLITAAPSLREKIVSGEISLSVAAQAQTFVKKRGFAPKPLIDMLVGQSSRETERILLKLSPTNDLPKEKIRAVSETETELRLVIDEGLKLKLDRLKSLLSHKNPDMKFVELINFLADFTLKKIDPLERHEATSTQKRAGSDQRSVRGTARREIWKRDNGQCSYTNPETGKKCQSKHLLQIDHIKPWSLGGTSNPENLRLLCHEHHRLITERTFGPPPA